MERINKSRHVELQVSIGGHDATSYISPSLIDFTFTDNASGKADGINITLHDRDEKWSGEWQPRAGTEIIASIICHNFEALNESVSLPCGLFIIDEISFSGPPKKIQIKALSLTSGIRDELKTKAWENYTLEKLAKEIANSNGVILKHYGDEITLKRQDQREENDLAFLHRIASKRGMNVKVHNGFLILFDAEQAEQKPSVVSISMTGKNSPKSYSFKKSSSNAGYSSATVAYSDPKIGTTNTVHIIVEQGDARANGKNLFINNRVESLGDAERLGKSELRKRNGEGETANLELMGNPLYRAGLVIYLTDFGEFSGSWIIEKATHKVGSSYNTSLDIKKTLQMSVSVSMSEIVSCSR